MVKLKAPIKDILGKAYYRYHIINDITNGTTGQTNKIMCTVTNIFGNPVENKEVTLTEQGVDMGTKTTNALGYVEWEIPLNTASLRVYRIDDHTTYTNVKNGGWKTYSPSINSYTTFYYNDDTRTAEFHYYRTNYSFTGTSAVTLHSGAIPSAYRPKSNIILSSYNTTIVGAVNTNGDILSATSTTGTKNINIGGMWHY